MERTEFEEPYVRVIREFLTGAEWLQNLTLYLNSYCRAFVQFETFVELESKEEKKLDYFRHEQFDLFHAFTQWVDLVLRNQLDQLGMDEKTFVALLERKIFDKTTSHDLATQIGMLLDMIESIDNFENFAGLMRSSYKRILQEEVEQTQMLHTQLQLKQWDLQVAVAISLLEAHQQGIVLTERDAALLPWAEAVTELQQVLERASAPGQRQQHEDSEIERLSDILRFERIKVEYAVAERLGEMESPSGSDNQTNFGGADIEEEPTTLSRLLEDSGTTQLAIAQQRNLVQQSNSILSDANYEKLYLFVREEMRAMGYRLNFFDLQTKAQTAFPMLLPRSSLIQDLIGLITLEDRLRRIHSEIQQELRDPGSIQYTSLGERESYSRRKNQPALSVNTSDAMQKISTYLESPANKYPTVSTPKEARDAIKQMQDNLRSITKDREIQHLKFHMQREAEKARENPTYLKSVHKIASKIAQLEAMGMAEEGELYSLSLQQNESYGPSGYAGNTSSVTAAGQSLEEDDTFSVGTEEDDNDGFQSDGTEEENTSPLEAKPRKLSMGAKGKTSLKIQARDAETPMDLLKETERLRKKLLLSGHSGAAGGVQDGSTGRNLIFLNSPKVEGKGIIAPKTAKEYKLSLAPTEELTINPSSLRFLAGSLDHVKY